MLTELGVDFSTLEFYEIVLGRTGRSGRSCNNTDCAARSPQGEMTVSVVVLYILLYLNTSQQLKKSALFWSPCTLATPVNGVRRSSRVLTGRMPDMQGQVMPFLLSHTDCGSMQISPSCAESPCRGSR